MPAERHDITIEAGATFQFVITWRNPDGSLVNLTGHTARMKVKSAYGGTTTFSLTTGGGGIVLGGAAGTITVTISATDTAAAIGSSEATHVYDLEVVSGSGQVWRVVQGKAFLKPEVTD